MSAGRIKKGTISHTRWRWHGIADGKKLVTLSISWIMETTHLDTPKYNLWNLEIEGLPNVGISIDLEKPTNYPFRTGPVELAVAASVMNSIPAVCEAAPGFVDIPVTNQFQHRF